MTIARSDLIRSPTGDDGALVMEFFVFFSRFEFALKRAHFVKKDRFGNASPDWDAFACDLNKRNAECPDEDFAKAKKFLIDHPPQRQVYTDQGGNKDWKWGPNKKRDNESEWQHLLRLVRDVRNNLFHGGKFPDGPVDGTERNCQLLRACLAILEQCRLLDDGVKRSFEER